MCSTFFIIYSAMLRKVNDFPGPKLPLYIAEVLKGYKLFLRLFVFACYVPSGPPGHEVHNKMI